MPSTKAQPCYDRALPEHCEHHDQHDADQTADRPGVSRRGHLLDELRDAQPEDEAPLLAAEREDGVDQRERRDPVEPLAATPRWRSSAWCSALGGALGFHAGPAATVRANADGAGG
jgi:hypothetical protein